MSSISAVVLSAKRARIREIEGLEIVHHQSFFADAAGFYAARLASISKVRTPHFFFMDDDDELPDDYLSVLAACVATGAAVAYTDEGVRGKGEPERVRVSGEYSPAAHVRNPLLVHHLALFRTDAVREALRTLPAQGHFFPEMMLSWEAARVGGAAYVPRVGYVWNRSASGMHTWPSISMAQTRSAIWCKERLNA